MKKDRNCMYPTYPIPYMPMNQGMPNMIPGMMPVIPGANQPGMMPGMPSQSTDMTSITNQINALEKRVSNLESLVGGNNTNYNTSTYQMM